MASNGTHEIASQSPAWLQERCQFWQRQLRLCDWDIAAEWTTLEVIDGATGKVYQSPMSREAKIRILAESEWPAASTRIGAYDAEQTLIHELLHIHMDRWRDDAVVEGTTEYEAKEAAIDCIAWALLRLERGERR